MRTLIKLLITIDWVRSSSSDSFQSRPFLHASSGHDLPKFKPTSPPYPHSIASHLNFQNYPPQRLKQSTPAGGHYREPGSIIQTVISCSWAQSHLHLPLLFFPSFLPPLIKRPITSCKNKKHFSRLYSFCYICFWFSPPISLMLDLPLSWFLRFLKSVTVTLTLGSYRAEDAGRSFRSRIFCEMVCSSDPSICFLCVMFVRLKWHFHIIFFWQ